MNDEAFGEQLLRDRLSSASNKGLKVFLPLLSQKIKPSVEPFAMLLQEGSSPMAVQSVLIDYRDHMLADEGLDTETLQEILRHFDRLGLLLMQAVTKHWQGKTSHLESRLSLANTELQLAAARGRWLREGEVTLYNYFREVPIMARVAVHDVRETGFGVDRSEDMVHVMAADQHGRFAYIRLPDLQTCLRLELDKTVGKRIYFKYAGTFLTTRERRQNIRVSCGDAPKALLTHASGEKAEAVICDMSQAGLGLEAQGLASIEIGSRLEFQLKLSAGELQGVCTVCWLREGNAPVGQDSSGPARFGVELDMRPALMRRLQFEVARRKKHILNELQMMGVPDILI